MAYDKILILGAKGMLGTAFTKELDQRGIKYVGLDRSNFDFSDPASLGGLDLERATVVNCVAYTDVDGAEANEDAATLLNAGAVGELARLCRERSAYLVHYSTDYVFNGESAEPYRVSQPRQPLGAYGRSKAKGEELIEQAGGRSLVLRTSWLYAPWGKNFVRTMIDLGHKRDLVKVVNDQCGRPTSAQHLCAVTLKLIAGGPAGVGATGTYHVTDGGECTWFGFTEEIFKLAGCKARLEPCSSAEFPRPARRPRYSVLDLSATEHLVGSMPPWQDNLAGVIAELQGA